MVEEAIKLYHDQFIQGAEGSNFTLLYWIPSFVKPTENENIALVPTLEDVKKVVLKLEDTSARGPDRLNGKFFQS